MEPAVTSPVVDDQPFARRSRRRVLLEIVFVYGFIVVMEWMPLRWHRELWITATVGVALVVRASFEGWQAIGFRKANFRESLWVAGVALAMTAAAFTVSGRLHVLHVPNGFLPYIAIYIPYTIGAILQQFLLQCVILLRLLRLIQRPVMAALVASVLFAMAHLPNPVLTPITLVLGFASCLVFLYYRNIYPLMIAHVILGVAVSMSVPRVVDHNMRVGLGYLQYNPHRQAHPPDRLLEP